MNKDELKQWLQNNKGLVNYSKIEKILGIPNKTLNRFESGERDMKDQYVGLVSNFIINVMFGGIAVKPNDISITERDNDFSKVPANAISQKRKRKKAKSVVLKGRDDNDNTGNNGDNDSMSKSFLEIRRKKMGF